MFKGIFTGIIVFLLISCGTPAVTPHTASSDEEQMAMIAYELGKHSAIDAMKEASEEKRDVTRAELSARADEISEFYDIMKLRPRTSQKIEL